MSFSFRTLSVVFVIALLQGCGPSSEFEAQSLLDNNQQEFGVLSWQADTETVDGFHIERLSISPDIGEVDFNGSLLVYPSQTTTYTLLVETRNDNGLVYDYTRKATVYVGARVDYDLIEDDNLRACLAENGATHLQQFDVIYCLDRGIAQLTGIEQFQLTQSVSLDNNLLTDLSPLTALPALKVVSVSGNELDTLDSLSLSTSVRNIVAHNNRLFDLSALSQMPQLVNLALDNNQISDLGPLQTIPQLQGLSVSHNRIEDVSPLTLNTELLALDFSNNPVRTGITALSTLTKATLIRSENNGAVLCLDYARLVLNLGPVVLFDQCRLF
ncbi:leucine-rich repeat domain-containing protein [Ketobacter sp.]|uniref:leucine-rich repeat domain-containing protein n=1 Tax=Ketobacter sp. TaxID=2083498 RepID=UPI000F1486F2|nr:leucine-rich repeat domain-containing protein [Ketobacter sp.]RLT94204.1 MAG: leucine-rich repeat domain-containing protein [Ketobacter sp.]